MASSKLGKKSVGGRMISNMASYDRYSLILFISVTVFTVTIQGESPMSDEGSDNPTRITGFSSSAALVPVGETVELRCNVASMTGGAVVQIRKQVPGSDNDVGLTINNIKEDVIQDVSRYTITATQNDNNGFDFLFVITDSQVKDSGTYFCLIPQNNAKQQVEVVIVSPPTSLKLYVDGQQVMSDEDEVAAQVIEYRNITHVNVTCIASGGHPFPEVELSVDSDLLLPDTSSIVELCLPQETSKPFSPSFECSTTVVIGSYAIDYLASGRTVTCSARSRGSADFRVSSSFIPKLAGAPPQIDCRSPVVSRLYEKEVRLVCHVHTTSPLIDAYITWPNAEAPLRPTTRPGWPPGVKFDTDDVHYAYLRQRSNETVLELEFERVFPRMFRDYTFAAKNDFGPNQQVVTLLKDPDSAAAHTNISRGLHDVISTSAYVIALIMSLFIVR